MNGRFYPISACDTGFRTRLWAVGRGYEWCDFQRALVWSALIHAVLIALPYFGMPQIGSPLPATAATTAANPVAHTPPLRVSLRQSPAPDGRLQLRQEAAQGAPKLTAAPLPEPPPATERRDGADLLPFPAPVYYPTDQLTRRPQPLQLVDLDAPQIKPILASGVMVLTLWIDAFGAVAKVDVEKSELPESFTKAAEAAFRQSRFTPGERSGQKVGSVMRIEVTYADGRLPPP